MCNNDVNRQLKFVQKQFLCAVPIYKIDWLNVFDNLNWEYQEILISFTVNLNLVLKYPIKSSYQKSFLKYIINRLEEQSSALNDCVYNAFGRVVALSDAPECFKHYLLENEQIISLKENSNIISEGTTGLCSWQGSLALSEWCLAHKDLFKNKTILELGSGVGLTGLTVAFNCNAKRIFLTDGHPSVVKVLEANVKLNCDSFKSDTDINVAKLSWEDNCDIRNIDMLLAADVIYDSSLFPSLLKVILYFFKSADVKEFIIACTERNKSTLEEFLSLLESNSLKYEEIENASQCNFVWSSDCPIRIFSCVAVSN